RVPSPEDLEFLDWLEESGIPTIPVVTKVDKVSKNELARSLAKISSTTGLAKGLLTPFSVQTRQGHAEVWELISMALQPEA
ncbi:MAG: ribosome biogenesis GTP-binding protein YihA/YsxC, partial [Desulfuromonadales bacterium]